MQKEPDSTVHREQKAQMGWHLIITADNDKTCGKEMKIVNTSIKTHTKMWQQVRMT